CECELVNINQAFPHDKLSTIQDDASSCNTRITPQSSFVMESALLGLQRRLPQLMKDVVELEEHHDEDLYSVLSLHVLENELIEIQLLMDKLNGSIRGNRELAMNTTDLLQDLKEGLADLEHFDTMQVVKRQQVNQRLKKDLDQCKNGLQPTDLDLATDESGVWVIYTTSQDFGNLVLSKVEEGESPKLNQTWHTSIYKQAVTNTFMACGVLYATRYVNTSTEEIFYSFDTATGKENFNVGIFLSKVSSNILFLNYSPVDQMLHAYCDSQMVSYR
uniref:Si:ch211-194m7.5 n=1 Tax=Oryzias latipes TaxID=8090 RepID=A0A3P9IM01_ORYLA